LLALRRGPHATESKGVRQMGKPIIKVNAELNVDDVVSVKLSSIETKLHDEDTRLASAIKDARGKTDEAKKQVKVAAQDAAENALSDHARTILDAFNTISPESKINISGFYEGGKIHAKFLVETGRRGNRNYIGSNGNAVDGYISYNIAIASTDAVLAALQRVNELEKSLAALQSQAVEIKKALSNMGMYERQIRAHLARWRLSETTDGRQIISKLDDFEVPGLLPIIPANCRPTVVNG